MYSVTMKDYKLTVTFTMTLANGVVYFALKNDVYKETEGIKLNSLILSGPLFK